MGQLLHCPCTQQAPSPIRSSDVTTPVGTNSYRLYTAAALSCNSHSGAGRLHLDPFAVTRDPICLTVGQGALGQGALSSLLDQGHHLAGVVATGCLLACKHCRREGGLVF